MTSNDLVNQIVENVMKELNQRGVAKAAPAPRVMTSAGGSTGVFERMQDAIDASIVAQKQWEKASKTQRRIVIEALRESMHTNANEFARMAQQETGMGRVEDKIAKHHNAATHTPGVEDLETRSWAGEKGLTYEDWAPYGVIAAITPSTHPIPVLFNSIVCMIAVGNGAVFNVHPAGKRVSAYAMEIFNRVIVENGGPVNLVSMVKEPTMDTVKILFDDPRLRLICATGGPDVVAAAFKSGKKVIAAGPGNPPVLVDETACVTDAAKAIIEGGAFDNNILCIAEKEVFVVESVYDKFMQAMADAGAVYLEHNKVVALVEQAFVRRNDGSLAVSRDFVGKNASVLAKSVGLNVPVQVRMLYGDCPNECPFVQEEQMMPYMPIVRVRDFEEGLVLALKAEHGFGHTAMIHSRNLKRITKYAQTMNTSIVVVNGSSLAGNGGEAGEGYFSHTIASPTGEGVCTPRNFGRVRRLVTSGTLQMV